MILIEQIKAEIERLRRKNHDDADNGCNEDECSGYELCLDHLLSFIESLEEEEQEDVDFVKQELERIRKAEKKVKLPELIDFWWMQEDMEGNQMIAKDKEHFASAMRKAYNVGLSQSESLEKEQDGTLAPDDPATNEEIKKMLDQRRIDMLNKVQKECDRELQEQYDNGYDDGYKEHEKVIAEYNKTIPKIKGWVARDEKDGRLDFFYKKPPIRGNKEWLPNGAGMISSIVFKDFCPDLKWEDEPIEVELTLKRI